MTTFAIQLIYEATGAKSRVGHWGPELSLQTVDGLLVGGDTILQLLSLPAEVQELQTVHISALWGKSRLFTNSIGVQEF
jgi:hypothetical protein